MNDEWLPETVPPRKMQMVTVVYWPFSERSKLSDRGLVDFRRVCEQTGILNRETDTIRSLPRKN